MTHYEKSLLWLYSALWILGFVIVLMDLTVWRANDPTLSASVKQQKYKAEKKVVR